MGYLTRAPVSASKLPGAFVFLRRSKYTRTCEWGKEFLLIRVTVRYVNNHGAELRLGFVPARLSSLFRDLGSPLRRQDFRPPFSALQTSHAPKGRSRFADFRIDFRAFARGDIDAAPRRLYFIFVFA